MNTLLTKTSLLAIFLVAVSGCTWVKVTPEAERVVVLPANRVSNCSKIGVVSSSVKASIMGVARNANKVREELDNLARQQAVALGANTLVRQSIVEGKGSYGAYNCP